MADAGGTSFSGSTFHTVNCFSVMTSPHDPLSRQNLKVMFSSPSIRHRPPPKTSIPQETALGRPTFHRNPPSEALFFLEFAPPGGQNRFF